MASVVISGDTSGSVTLSAPSVAGSTTISLPAFTGIAMIIGTWQDVTASRALGTTYTNSTGNAIFVSVYATTGTGAGTIKYTINSVDIGVQGISAGASCTMRNTLTFIVPNGATYSVTGVAGTNTLTSWFEIR